MPTAKPRITITLSDHQHAVLQRMSALAGCSMSSVVVDLLDTALPMLERVVVAMQAASTASDEAKQGLKSSFEKAEKDLLPQLSAMMGQLDMLLEPLPAGVSALAGAPAGGGSKTKRPPTTNRGVRIPPKPITKSASKPRPARVSGNLKKGVKK